GLVCGAVAGALFGAMANALEHGWAHSAVLGLAASLKQNNPKLEDPERTARGALALVAGVGLTLAFGSVVWAAGRGRGRQAPPPRKPLLGQAPSPGEFSALLRKSIPYLLAGGIFVSALASLEGLDRVLGASGVSLHPATGMAVVGAAWGAVGGLLVCWLGRQTRRCT